MKRTTYQTEAAECGLACLVMIAENLGYRIDLLTLRSQVGPYPRGMKLTDLISCADQLRIESRAIRINPNDLLGLRLPAVMHWEMSHFVVVDRVFADGSVDIRDPATGRRRASSREVSAKFTGIAIEFAIHADFKPVDRRVEASIWRLWKGKEKVRKPLSRILLVSALIEIVGLGSPIFMQVLTDRVIPTNDLTFAMAAAFVALVMILSQASGSALRTHLLEALRANLSIRASGSLFSHMLGLRAEYFQSRQAGDLQSRFKSLDEIHRGISGPVVTTFFDATVGLVVIFAISMYSMLVAAFIVICSLAYITVRFSMHGPTMAAHEGSIISATRRDSFLLETVRGIEALKAFNASAARTSTFSNLTVEAASDQYRVSHLTNIYQFLSAVVLATSNIGTIVFCAWMVISQEMTLGMLFAVVLLRATFMSRMLAAFDAIMQLKTLELHAQRVSEISREVRSTTKELPGESAGPCEVEISGVSFIYPGSRVAVISDCNFKIADGESIGIVGASGSGKTTLGKLIVGMLLPTAGHVSVCSEIVHGEDAIRRHRMALVSQSDILFSGTIAQNICMYDHDPDIERMRGACENACILTDIEKMPLGFNTPIGEGGTAMSGGQKQRLCLARALYRMPRLLLLDEATSHLDIPTEVQVLERLASLSMTRIHIAHRPQSIAFCDRIFNIENGKELTTDQALLVAQA